jgi:hypothetical protein
MISEERFKNICDIVNQHSKDLKALLGAISSIKFDVNLLKQKMDGLDLMLKTSKQNNQQDAKDILSEIFRKK